MIKIIKKIVQPFYSFFRKKLNPYPIRPRFTYRERVKVAATASFGFRSKLMVYDGGTPPLNTYSIQIGKYCHLGNNSEIHSYTNMTVKIHDNTSINDNCKIIGDVTIEKHCLFASNIYISSGKHQMDLKPEWLIKDQDNLIPLQSFPIHVEEDCWIGWGVVILPGVKVGKGAVLGANAVVTKDVLPYTINAGIPSRILKKRIDFNPPDQLNYNDPHILPYLYRGFGITQTEIANALSREIIFSGNKSIAVLAVANSTGATLTINGKLNQGTTCLKLQVAVNDYFSNVFEITESSFSLAIPLTASGIKPGEQNAGYVSLCNYTRSFTCVCFDVMGASADDEYYWGLQSISLH